MKKHVLFIFCLSVPALSAHMIGDGRWQERLESPSMRPGALDQEKIQHLYKEYAGKDINHLSSTDRRDLLMDALWDLRAPAAQIFRVIKTYGIDNTRHGQSDRCFQDRVVFEGYNQLTEEQKRRLKPITSVDDLLEERARASYHQHIPLVGRFFRMPKRRHLIGLGVSSVLLGVGKFFFDRLEQKMSEVNGHRVAAQRRVITFLGHAHTKRLKQRLKSDLLPDNHRAAIEEYLAVDKRYTRLTLQWLTALATFTAGSLGTAGSLFAHVRRDPVDHWRAEVKEYEPVVPVAVPAAQ